MTKKRTLNEYRQSKEYTKNPWALYGPPKIGSEGEVDPEVGDDHMEPTLYDQLVDLRKQYPNDQQFGYHVAKELL
jgi:hypothetical protein